VTAKNKIAVVLGTERVIADKFLATALVFDRNGTRVGFQDKVQLDPSEESMYSPGSERRLFSVDDLRFGIVICHEGWRYPETSRWAAWRGAQLIFHPQFMSWNLEDTPHLSLLIRKHVSREGAALPSRRI
jgi:predicted amidohydrolase